MFLEEKVEGSGILVFVQKIDSHIMFYKERRKFQLVRDFEINRVVP